VVVAPWCLTRTCNDLSVGRCPSTQRRGAVSLNPQPEDPALNLFAWIAFGAIAGYTAFHLAPIDDSIGESGQVLIALVGSLLGGIAGALLLGVDPFALRIDMAPVSTGVVGSVAAIVGWEESRRRRLVRVEASRPARGR